MLNGFLDFLLGCHAVIVQHLGIGSQLTHSLGIEKSLNEQVLNGLLLSELVIHALGSNVNLDGSLQLLKDTLRHLDHGDDFFLRLRVNLHFLHVHAVHGVNNQVFQPDSRQVLQEVLVGFLLLGHRSLRSLLNGQNSTTGSIFRIDRASSGITSTRQVSCHLNQVFLQLLHIGRHLSRGQSTDNLVNVIHGCAVGANGAAHGVQCRRVGNLAHIHDLLRICLILDGQHSSDLGAVHLNLVGNQIPNLALTSGASLFFLPVEVCNGIKGQACVGVLADCHPACRHGEMHGAFALVHLVDDRHHVIQFQLGRFAAFLEGIGVANDIGRLFLTHAHTLGQLNRIDHGHTLTNQDIGLILDFIVILIAVVDVILLHDLIDRHHALLVKVDIHNALVIDSRILGQSAAFEVHLVLLPHSRRIAVEHIAVSATLLLELHVLKVLRRVVDGVQIVVNDRHLVLDDGLNEVLLNWLNISQLGTFPLVAVIHTVIAVSVYIDTCLPMVVSALLVQSPNRSFLNLSDVHLITPCSAHRPVPGRCHRTSQCSA